MTTHDINRYRKAVDGCRLAVQTRDIAHIRRRRNAGMPITAEDADYLLTVVTAVYNMLSPHFDDARGAATGDREDDDAAEG
jgi:hypothetical protein